ncbi:MAG: hypothetical protein LQ346_008744 [Caloplaca aetnensis]|nr:MAG: hypothetical protein LQ346_008744 [Caloplaca aetnensis]
MGAAGLKKFAQAGVDIHTLLCMGEIAEVCPASLEYRKEITACRQKQRKQSIWLYKVVEIGTASNFLADELLKKRAGENIVALMSIILPILSEDDCDSFILGLFENCHIDLDKTPGLAQLQAFRDAILPLAQKLSFKDRTYQYHMLLEQLHDGVPPKLCTSVPGITTLVQVVLMLQKMVMENSCKYVFIYRGWQGAAWVIAYARHVLGLPVCVLRTQHDTVPINGQYQDSRVFIYLFDQESRCELVTSGLIPDLVIPTDSMEHTQWAIDLDNVNLRKLYLPDDPTSAEAASVITESLALSFTSRRACHLASLSNGIEVDLSAGDLSARDGSSASPYSIYCLPHLHQRTRAIIKLMGFRTGLDFKPNADTWKEYFQLEDYDNRDRVLLTPGRKWIRCGLPYFKGLIKSSRSWEGQRLLRRMFRVAEGASCLAFSNWGLGVSVLSTTFLENGVPADYSPMKLDMEKTDSLNQTIISLHFKEVLHDNHKISGLMQDMAFIVTGRFAKTVDATSALETQSIVIARAAATQYSISLHAAFIHFYPGHIMMLGQRRWEIKVSVDHSGNDFHHEILDSCSFGHRPRTIAVHPLNGFPHMTIESMATLARGSIEVTHNLVLGGWIHQLEGPTFSNDKIVNSHVTRPCSHSYYSPASIVLGTQELVRSGLYLGFARMTSHDMTVDFQAVDGNPYGQWASLHCGKIGQTMPHFSGILQRNMCTECTIEIIRGWHGKSIERRNWSVIAAGGAEEAESDSG